MEAPSESPVTVAHAFTGAINRQNPDELAMLMTEDHLFVDSLGNRVQGREAMRAGWRGYFSLVPDYTITVEETYAAGGIVVMLGMAQGTTNGGRWQTPATWRADIRGSQIASWRVYADNEPIRKLLANQPK